MIKINGLQGSTMSHIQKETDKMASDINQNFKQVIGLDNDVRILEETQYYNINTNTIENDYILDNNKIFVAYNYLEISKDVTLEIKYNSTLFIDDINKDNTTYDYYNLVETATNQRWIDGRVIYRKVINFGTLPNATSKTISHNIGGATVTTAGTFRFINAYGIALSNTVNYIQIPFTDNTAGGRFMGLYLDGTTVGIVTNYNWTSYTETWIILEYVK